MMGVGGGTRFRLTVVSGGVSAGWVWHMLVATYVWVVGCSAWRLQGPL
jgi:hypothetical protein